MIELPLAVPLERLLALKPQHLAVRADPNRGHTAYLDFSDSFELKSSDPESGIEKLSNPLQVPNELSFSGWIGFFGYEFLAAHYGLNLSALRDLTVPGGWFGRPSTLIRLGNQSTTVESCVPGREEEIVRLLESSSDPLLPDFRSTNQQCNLSFQEYKNLFHQAREAILDGETYQIKISQRFEANAQIDPLLAYAKLSQANPAPEAFLLKTPEFSIVSCSPEVVIQKTGKEIVTRPIGGTYAREPNASDHSVIEQFLGDPKEVSEHNMLVDLERNDLSTLCVPGSVRLERFREVETYSHLHHLVSTIRGELRSEINLSDILRGMLPGGSITGCPKTRTMEWIDRLEPCFRGPYTGSFGVLEDGGDMRLNLIIRSMLILEDRCYTQAGGGIVVNSTPEYEYRENQIKAQALLDLLQ